MGGPGYIPISEVLAYCELIGLHSAWEREEMLYLVREMDKEYLQHQVKNSGDGA